MPEDDLPEYESFGPPAAVHDNTGVGTDLWFARRFAREHGANLKYVWEWKTWMAWVPDEGRWKRDAGAMTYKSAKDTLRRIMAETADAHGSQRERLWKAAHRFMGASAIDAALRLARSEEAVLASPDDWDQHPHLLNCPNCTIDLRTGKSLPHNRDHRITYSTGVEYLPDAESKLWEQFLARILPDNGLRAYVQRAMGYSSIGSVTEHLLLVGHGIGANGKSVLFGVTAAALGEYSVSVPVELLLASGRHEHPAIKTILRGARLAMASETPEGGRLNEAALKMLTGSDSIRARGMGENWYEFKPSHTLWLATNHKPRAKESTLAFWRRMRLMPFTVTIPPQEQDRQLPAKLEAELPAILKWVVDGAVDYWKDGLNTPAIVAEATNEYREEEDELREFVELYEVGLGWTSASEIHQHFVQWSKEQGVDKPIGQRTLTKRLKDRGWEYGKLSGRVRGFKTARRSETDFLVEKQYSSRVESESETDVRNVQRPPMHDPSMFQGGRSEPQTSSGSEVTKPPPYSHEELSEQADREADSGHG